MNCPRCDKPTSEHEAGPETDACVAVVVFDREECPVHQSLWCCSRGKAQYSQKIADAWKVVEKLKEAWDSFDCGYGVTEKNKWGARLWKDHHIIISELASTAPLAICRAALIGMSGDRN